MVDTTTILAGAMPAAALALAADGRSPGSSAGSRDGTALDGAPSSRPAIARSCCSCVAGAVARRARRRRPIVVGSKNFTEQVILGELVAQALEAEGRARGPEAESRRHVRLRSRRCGPATSTSMSSTRAPRSRRCSTKRCPHDPGAGARSARASCTPPRQLTVLDAARLQQHVHDPGPRPRTRASVNLRTIDDLRPLAGRLDARLRLRVPRSARTAIPDWCRPTACSSARRREAWTCR